MRTKNASFSKNIWIFKFLMKSAPGDQHSEQAYEISLSQVEQFSCKSGLTENSGEEEEPHPGRQKRNFQRVIKSELNGNLMWGKRYSVPPTKYFPKISNTKGQVDAKLVFETCKYGQLLCRIYSTRSQRRLSWKRGGDRCRGRWIEGLFYILIILFVGKY